MKRQNLTAIVSKAVLLDFDAVMISLKTDRLYSVNAKRIIKATVNELIRMQATTEAKEFINGFTEGYDKGFETCRIAETVSITAGGVVSELQNAICGNLKPIQP